jgi:hypothetical protein
MLAIAEVINFMVEELGVRKLSILAIGEGSQLVLKYISVASLKLFEYLDKVILINCEYAGFKYTHSNS